MSYFVLWVGWGGVGQQRSSDIYTHTRGATLRDVLLRWGGVGGGRVSQSCYAVGRSLACADIRHATLLDVLLHVRTYLMIHY